MVNEDMVIKTWFSYVPTFNVCCFVTLNIIMNHLSDPKD